MKSVDSESLDGEEVRLLYEERTRPGSPKTIDLEATPPPPPSVLRYMHADVTHRLRINFEPSGMGSSSPTKTCPPSDGDGGGSAGGNGGGSASAASAGSCGADVGKTFPSSKRNGFQYGWTSSGQENYFRDRSNSSRSHRKRGAAPPESASGLLNTMVHVGPGKSFLLSFYWWFCLMFLTCLSSSTDTLFVFVYHRFSPYQVLHGWQKYQHLACTVSTFMWVIPRSKAGRTCASTQFK